MPCCKILDTNSLVAFASAVANKMLVTTCLVSLACIGQLKLVQPGGTYLVSLRMVFSGWHDSLLLLRGASWQAKEVLHQARPPVQGPLGQLPTHGLLHCVLDDLVHVIMHHSAGRGTVRDTESTRIQGHDRRSATPCQGRLYLIPVIFMQHNASDRTTPKTQHRLEHLVKHSEPARRMLWTMSKYEASAEVLRG